MKVLHQVGVALKEQKVVDNRPKAAPSAPVVIESPKHVDVKPLNLKPTAVPEAARA
jgi:hypothetical protein